jgi:predicted nucleic acid-binding protein
MQDNFIIDSVLTIINPFKELKQWNL